MAGLPRSRSTIDTIQDRTYNIDRQLEAADTPPNGVLPPVPVTQTVPSKSGLPKPSLFMRAKKLITG